jgi:hypothetical protein
VGWIVAKLEAGHPDEKFKSRISVYAMVVDKSLPHVSQIRPLVLEKSRAVNDLSDWLLCLYIRTASVSRWCVFVGRTLGAGV